MEVISLCVYNQVIDLTQFIIKINKQINKRNKKKSNAIQKAKYEMKFTCLVSFRLFLVGLQSSQVVLLLL